MIDVKTYDENESNDLPSVFVSCRDKKDKILSPNVQKILQKNQTS